MVVKCFFQEHLNAEMYLDFLVNQLPLLLEEVPLCTRQRMRFLHDAHANQLINGELNVRLPARWIGRNGPVQQEMT